MNDTNQAPATPPKTMTGKEICQALWKVLWPMIISGAAVYFLKYNNRMLEERSERHDLELQQKYERR